MIGRSGFHSIAIDLFMGASLSGGGGGSGSGCLCFFLFEFLFELSSISAFLFLRFRLLLFEFLIACKGFRCIRIFVIWSQLRCRNRGGRRGEISEIRVAKIRRRRLEASIDWYT